MYVFFQLIILRPHPHFTRHVRKRNPQNHLHFNTFEYLQARRSAFYQRPLCGLCYAPLWSFAVFSHTGREPDVQEERT